MTTTDDRRDHPLPVTNEVGSEGGSYGDATQQVETFESPLEDARQPGIGGPGSAANYAIRRDDIVSTETPPESGMRYPTEPPARAKVRDGHDARPAAPWAPGLVGAAAGLAIGLIAARRR